MEKFNELSLLKRFVKYYKPYKWLFILDLVLSLILSVTSVFYPIVTRYIFNVFVPNKDVANIVGFSMLLLGIYLLRYLCQYFVTYYGHGLGTKIQADMRKDLFSKYEDLSFSYFDEHETGALMSRLCNDLQNISEVAHHGPENLIISTFTIVSSLAYLFTINWILALIIGSCMPILLIFALSMRQKELKAFAQTKTDIAHVNAHVENAISGIRVTKAFNNRDLEIQKFEKGNRKFMKSKMYAYKLMSIYHSTTKFIITLFNVACILGGALIAIYTDAFTIGDYLAFAVSISLFITPLTTLIEFVEQYQDGITGFKRFVEVMDVPIEEGELEKNKDLHLKGNISFKNVSFKYETSEEILTNISFDIKCGENVALVGESGGGKTTICHLLPHFYKVASGSIEYDGINIEDISLSALRNNIGIVQQDVFLFGGTVRENVIYGKLNATEEEIIEACKKANIYDFIMSLPKGFDTRVGERGVKLSGGQKQRISIARIFLKNPSILILDEATSALDNTTESLIQSSLDELAKNRTCIVVAHRLSTVKNADRILVINHGEIVEEGTHEQLIKLNKEYARLYNLQFKI